MKPTNDMEKAIGSFRLKTSDGLDQRVAADILAGSAAPAPDRQPDSALARFGKSILNKRWTRYATAAVIVMAVVLAMVIVNQSASLSLADVKAAVAEHVHSVRYQLSCTYSDAQGREKLTSNEEILIAAPSRMRQTNAMGVVMVTDEQVGKALLMIVPTKEAILLEHTPPPELQGVRFHRQERNLLDELKALDESSARPLGHKTIAGRTAVGFEIAGGKETVWVDPQTRLPLQIHRVAQTLGEPPMTESIAMSGFEWNCPVDESLLSLTPPDGYTVSHDSLPGRRDGEAQLLQLLRRFAEVNGGRFPEDLNLESFEQGMLRIFQQKDRPNAGLADMHKEIMSATEGMAFLESPTAGDWHYAGMGVALDQADTPILWYRPKGSAGFRVIYADMSVREMPADALPTVPSKPVHSRLAADRLDYDATATVTEADLLVSLQLFAELNDNRLPDRFDRETIDASLEQIRKRQGHMTVSEKAGFTLKHGRITHGIAIVSMDEGGDWHYAGAGVQLDTPNRPVLWYRPKGATIYRVIHADLSVREVRPEDLPKVPSTLLRTVQAGPVVSGGPAENPLIEHDLVEALRYLAELSGGEFPEQIDMTTYHELQRQAEDLPEADQRLHQQKMLAIFNGFRFVTDSSNGEDWHYAGKGVALGQADVPILWYRPRDSTTYRVIHADLAVRSAAPQALPDMPSLTLTSKSIFASESERDLLHTLRTWADLNGGRFPADLSRTAMKECAYADAGKDLRQMSPDEFSLHVARQQKKSRMGRGIIFLARAGKYQYAGVEVPLGQADTPILWYQPRKSQTWRVIYADLTVRDVAQENLPPQKTSSP